MCFSLDTLTRKNPELFSPGLLTFTDLFLFVCSFSAAAINRTKKKDKYVKIKQIHKIHKVEEKLRIKMIKCTF